MRAFILIIAALMVFGCAQPETPPENVTNLTNETNLTNQTNVTVPECSGPVCGSDGETYQSDCEAEEAGLTYTAGECAVDCTETDDGIDTKESGRLTLGSATFDDHCLNSTYLLEYACLENEAANATVFCEHGCSDGACQEPEPEPEDIGCVGPVEPDVMVAESVTYNKTEYKDVCADYTTVKDYYCKDKEVKAANSQCPAGLRCEGGACKDVPETCTESDLGKDIYDRGRTVHSKGLATLLNEWDECVDDGMVREYYCTLNGSEVEEIECGSGYKCASGRCIESDCHDTDKGFDIYKAGSTENLNEEKDDHCVDDYKLREYFCYGDDVESDVVTCPEDHICRDDRCVEGEIK